MLICFLSNPFAAAFLCKREEKADSEMSTLAVDSTAVDASNARKKRKKSRIIQKGYHKSQRGDARRVAAKAFLSGIVLDRNFQPPVTLRDSGEQGSFLGYDRTADSALSRPISSASRHSNALFLGDESLYVDVSGEGRLYEIALDNLPQLLHHSPSKVAPSKSLDYGTGTPLINYKPVGINHSVSVTESQSERRRANILALAHKKWQALDYTPAVYHLNTLTDTNSDWLVDSRSAT